MSRWSRSGLFSVSNPREIWLITAAHAVNEFYSVALPPILPLLVTDFSITYGEAGALLTIFFATYSIFQLPAGMLSDRIGQRWLLAGGMVVLAAGMLIAAGAQNYRTLVVAEALAGIGGSTYHPAGMSLISDLESGETEGRAMGIHSLGGVGGTALAPVLVGGLASLFDWRLALTVSAAVGVGYALAFLALFRDVDDSDGAAVAESDSTTTVESDGAATVESDGAGGQRERTATADGYGSRWDVFTARISVPLERWIVVLFLANLAIAIEIGAVRTFVTSYLVEHANMTTGFANGIFFVMLVGAGVSSLGGGRLADALDRRSLGFGAMVAAAVVILGTAFVPLVPMALITWFFLLGVVIWLALPTMNAITSSYSERAFSGSLFGIMLTAGSLGGALGPLLFGIVAERVGLGVAFPMVAVVSAIGAIAFLVMYRV